MKTKTIPFDLETAKKIQAGEIEGRIVTDDGLSVRLLCTDANLWGGNSVVVLIKGKSGKDMIFDFDSVGKKNSFLVSTNLIIELPVEKSKHEFKPFDRVLVREDESDVWECRLFDRFFQDKGGLGYCCQDGVSYDFCIPYEGNEHLVGTTDKPKED